MRNQEDVMMHGGFGFFGMLVVGALVVVPLWRICIRIGHPGWISLAALVPIANLLLLYFLAFSEWPLERRSGGQPGASSNP
jgi:uncharacterized protein (DUF983 family)